MTTANNVLPSGLYWIGDPNSVLDSFFENGLDSLDGIAATNEGKKIAIFPTAHGDGIYYDQDGDEYGVDTGRIGCIPIDCMDQESDMGLIVLFKEDFICQWIAQGGFVCFGDLAIRTDTLNEDILSCPVSQLPPCCLKLEQGTELAQLILSCQDEVDSDTRLVMHEIAFFIEYDELGDASNYSTLDGEERKSLFDIYDVVLHSEFDEFKDYFRGYYATLDNAIHDENVESGLTKTELYDLLDRLDWPKIFELSRRYCGHGAAAALFKLRTGFDYYSEKEKYPSTAWDGKPCWQIVDGRYVGSD